jgi:UDP-N-acetylmuramoyl-L-alanyl-D-glutamate--2,6-diaminopimelate ligase
MPDAANDLARARERAPAAVVSQPSLPTIEARTTILVENSCSALGSLLSAAYGRPSKALELMAVTGTNGKTTVSHLVRHILCNVGLRCEVIGTLGATLDGAVRDTGYTLPPASILQPLLEEMRTAGVTHVTLEATSQGLVMDRLAGTSIAVAGMINLSRDHLDFHHDWRAYIEAKATLFRQYAQKACFNVDDPLSARLYDEFRGPKLSVSTTGNNAEVALRQLRTSPSGTVVIAAHGGESLEFELPLVGRHNVENAGVALGMSLIAGISFADGAEALQSAKPPGGRLERVGRNPAVLVDYAHTPAALERVLTELRQRVDGRLICVFGAGGRRDRGKRPLMGRIVSRSADVALVTSDNPRDEAPSMIIEEILAGADGQAEVWIEPDRRKAIRRAVEQARHADTVLVAGRGHEAYQEVGGARRPFNDAAICREELAMRRGVLHSLR